MNQTIKQYKQTIQELLEDKKYTIILMLVTILSFGFAITHESVGPDDLCFDRYFQDTYILSQGRWVTYLLYNILQITSFSPFWLELLTTIVLFFTAIILTAFLKKQLGNKLNNGIYLLFSCLFISFPIAKEYFVYQIPSLAITIGNLLMIIIAILIYENYYNLKSKKIFIILGIMTAISICIYESCIQTFLVMIFFQTLIRAKFKEDTTKDAIKYVLKAIIQLAIGVLIYKIIGDLLVKVLGMFGVLQKDYALHTTIIEKIISLKDTPELVNQAINTWLKIIIVTVFVTEKSYITVFIVVQILALVLSIVDSIKKKKVGIFLSVLGLILANYIFTIIMQKPQLRINYSWSVSMALLLIYIYILVKDMKYATKIFLTIYVLLVVYNTRILNNQFYNEYLGYEKDKSDAYTIARQIYIQCEDVTKPVYYIIEKKGVYEREKYIEGRTSVLKWGVMAFDEKATETTKFINSLGYNFSYITKEQAAEAFGEYKKIKDTIDENQWVIELEKYILVKLEFIE